MIQCIKTELYKTTHNRYFIISLFSLLLLIVVHIALNIIPYYGMIYGEYLETVFNHWIGLQLSSLSNIYYMVVVGCATLPIGMVYIEERQHGYMNQLITRSNRTKIAISKLIAYFVTGFIITTIPLIVDYMAASVFLPSIRPIAATSYYTVSGNSFLSDLFYTNPTAYLFIYIAIDGVLVSFFSLLVVLAAKIIQNIYAAVCCPMVVVIVLKIVLGFINAENYIPMRILYPSTSEGIKTANVVMVIALTGVIGIIGMICEVGKYET